MKLTIVNKETNEPLLILSEDTQGMSVVGGDPKMVNALKLNQFGDLKEIADYINSDPNSNLAAVGETDDQGEEAGIDQKIAPALKILKELMAKVNTRQAQAKTEESQKSPEAQAAATMGAEIMASPGRMMYVSYDGDNIGNAVARAEDKDDEQELAQMSAKINAGQQIAIQWCQSVGGTMVEYGGDEGLMKVPSSALERIEDLRNAYEGTVGATLTVGVGYKISESTKARMLGKLKGKNRTEVFDDSTIKELALRQEEDDHEAKKIKSAMTGPGAQQPLTPQVNDGSLQAGPGPDDQAAGADQAQEGTAPQEGSSAEEPGQPGVASGSSEDNEEFLNISPELLKAAATGLRKDESPESIFANSHHDPKLENSDYSYSDDPEFSKSLRYIAKHEG